MTRITYCEGIDKEVYSKRTQRLLTGHENAIIFQAQFFFPKHKG